MKRQRPSLAKLYKVLISLMILFSVLTGALFLHVRRAILEQVLLSNHSDIEKEISDLDKICTNVNYTLIRMLSENEDVQVFLEADSTAYQRNSANMELQASFRTMRDESLDVCNYFFYDAKNDTMILPLRAYANPQTENQIKQLIYHHITEGDNDSGPTSKMWELYQMEQEQDDFIVKFYRSGEQYVGCWISLDSIFSNFGANEYSTANRHMMLEQGGQIVVGEEDYQSITGTDALHVGSSSRREIRGNYEISWYAFEKGRFSFVFLTNVLDNFQIVQNTLFFLIALLVCLFIASIFLLIYMQKKLLRPVSYFVDHLSLENILKQNEEMQTEYQPYFKEMAQVDEMFKNAAQQIGNLKIAMYENEMEKNQIEMDYLQQQIKPHFYLNCMNIIYNMAQFGRMEEIQKFSIEITEYLRGIFRRSDQPVTLRDEISHVEKYLDINKVRYEDDFDIEIRMDAEIADCVIMPLMIHTFVENSIKHALFGKRKLKIVIEIERELRDGKKMLHIRVCDNGSGFPENVLETLNSGQNLATADGKRIGLSNTARRIRFFYQGNAELLFSNKESGGARSEIWIPEERMEQKA